MPWSSADIKALQKIEGSDQYSSTRKLIQDLDEVLISFEAAEREKIIAARDLSLLVHIEQQDRPDGQPYVNHPLKVALNVARKFGFTSSDAIAASLLHDSVEDQPDRLLELLQGVPSGMKNIEQEALRLIGEYSGAKVSDMVARLTNPDFKEMVVQARQAGDPRTTEGLTIEFYKAHFLEIMEKDLLS